MTSQPFMKKRWVRGCSAILLAAVLALLLLPSGIKLYIAHWLEHNGADSASIRSFAIDPLTGRVSLQGMEVQSGGKSLFRNSSMVLDFALTPLRHRDIHLERAEYRDLSIDLEHYADGRWRVGSYTVQDMAAGAGDTPHPVEEGAAAWAFVADKVVMDGCRIHLKTPEVTLEIVIDHGELTHFTTRAGQPAASLLLKGSVDGSPVELQLSSIQLSPDLRITGTVALGAGRFAWAEAFVKDVLPLFAGEAGLDGKITLSQSAGGGIEVEYDGSLSAHGVKIAGESFATSAQRLEWQGRAGFSQPPGKAMVIVTDGLLAATAFSLKVPGAGFATEESRIELNGRNTVSAGENIRVENEGSLLIEGVSLRLPALELSEERLFWQGGAVFNSLHPTKGLEVSTRGQLDLGPFAVAGGEKDGSYDGSGDTLSWRGNIDYQAGSTVPAVHLEGGLSGTGLFGALVQPGLLFAQDRVELQAKASLQLGDQPVVTGTGALGIEQFALRIDDNPFLALDTLKLEGLEARPEGDFAMQNLASAGLQLSLPGALPLLVRLPEIEMTGLAGRSLTSCRVDGIRFRNMAVQAVAGSQELVQLADLSLQKLKGEGQITLQGVIASGIRLFVPGDTPLSATIPEVEVSDIAGQYDATYSAGRLGIKGAVVTGDHSGQELLRFSELRFDELRGKGAEQFAADSVLLEKLAVLEKTAGVDEKEVAALSIGRSVLTGLRWTRALGLHGDTLHFSELIGALIRDRDGTPAVRRHLAAMQKTGVGQAPGAARQIEPSAEQEKVVFSLGRLEIDSSSSLGLTDNTLAVPFTTNLKIASFEVSGLHSGAPEQRATVRLAGSFENKAPVELTGEVAPFLAQPALDLELNLKNYPLTSLSGYTVQSVGTAMAGGQLRLKSRARLAGEELEMENSILLQKLETQTISPELAAQLNNQLPVPLDAALALLSDGQGNIALEVPLNGPVRDLSVGISGVLISALGKAIVPAASGYLMYALGPYGALAYVGYRFGEKLLEVKLPPLLFQAGEVTLSEEHGGYLERIAMILKDRPETDMRFCPVVASWELLSEAEQAAIAGDRFAPVAGSEEKLLELGRLRFEAVRDRLSGGFGIKEGRLLFCDTRIVEEKNGQPAILPQL